MPRIAWILILGILFVRMALFMSYPFLALHLTTLHFTAMDIGFILGAHYLFSGITGIIGGNAADRWNPKLTIVATLCVGAFSFFGLSQADDFFSFLFFNCCLAISTSTFEPIASVLITDNIATELHALAFRYRYIAINMGAALGPLVGSLLVLQGSQSSFLVTGVLLSVYAFLFLLLKIKRPTLSGDTSKGRNLLKDALGYMAQDKAFLLLIAANVCATMTYGQIFSTLPQILHMQIEDSHRLYSFLLVINPIIVIIAGFFLSKFLSKQSLKKMFSIGSILLAVSFTGFHFSSTHSASYIIFMILFTFAEMALIPSTSKFLFDLAPKEYKGSYLGAESSSYLGFFLGNLIGGWLLQQGQGVFLFCIFSSVASLLFYRTSLHKANLLIPNES